MAKENFKSLLVMDADAFTKRLMLCSAIRIVTLMVAVSNVTPWCLWNCEQLAQSSASTATTVVSLNGNNNTINYWDKLRQAHDDHMTDIKIGLFTIAGIMILCLSGIAIWWLRKRYQKRDHERVLKRAMSMIRRGEAIRKPELPPPDTPPPAAITASAM